MSDTLATIHRPDAAGGRFLARGYRRAPGATIFFHLLRRIDAQGGERYPLGRAPLPKFESLRIGQTPSMGFAPATLASAQKRANSAVHEISILSFGLFGPNGPLPVHMTEYARERIHHHQDDSPERFCRSLSSPPDATVLPRPGRRAANGIVRPCGQPPL